MINKNQLVLTLLGVLCSIGLFAQVSSVNYQLKFDSTTCWYDLHLVITGGNAYSSFHRTQFNSSIGLLIPTGSTLTVAQTYNPIKNNQSFNGTTPQSWNIGASVLHPDVMPDIDFWLINPTLYPTAQYDSLNVGDTVKLFSLNIDMPNPLEHHKIRLYENGVDPDGSQLGGGDFSNGFTVGSPSQVYVQNEDQLYPSAPYNIQENIDTSTTALVIDVDPQPSAACQGQISCNWTGPNGYSGTDEDVNIDPFSSLNFGDYTLIMTDEFGIKDTSVITVEQAPNNGFIVDDLILTPMINNIGYHLNYSGDENENSQVTFAYKRTGENSFLDGPPTMNMLKDTEIDGQTQTENFNAGSVMNLSPNTRYDLRLTIDDPDLLMPLIIDTSIVTQGWHLPVLYIDTLYVVPGSGGGDGSIGNPYQGIQIAIDNAGPGDVVLVSDGTYAPFTVLNGGTEGSPILIRSLNLHGATIDGGNTTTGIITLGNAIDSISHINIDGFRIQNGKWGVDAQNTQFITVRNNIIEDVDFGFVNRRENGWEHHQYVFNNKITGRTVWPQTNGNIPSERGIDIRGNFNDISYNTISDFGDGISTDGPRYQTSYALDIHHNDITRIVDDMIEIDGIVSNARVYNNRCFNGRAGISLAPIFGGPAYIYRNELVNMEYSALKMNRSPSGLIIAHNTIVNSGDGLSSPSGWKNVYLYNNLIFSGGYCFQEYELTSMDTLYWDYNGYYSNRAGNAAQPWFKWDNVKYNLLTDLSNQTVLAEHGVQVELSDVENVVIPNNFSIEVLTANIDLTPKASSPIQNNGKTIANLNDGYVLDNFPDLGAIELGGPTPTYGHDFGTTCDRNDLSQMTWNGIINDDWYEPYNWTPCGIPIGLSEVIIPGMLTQYPTINTDVHIDMMYIYKPGLTTVKGEGVDIIVGQ